MIKLARKELRKAYKIVKNDPSNLRIVEYREQCQLHLEFLLRRKSEKERSNLFEKIIKSKKQGNMKKYWDLVKSIVPNSSKMKIGDVLSPDGVENFFKNVYEDRNFRNFKFTFSVSILDFDISPYSSPLVSKEISDSLFAMRPSKAPGPDGVGPNFFRTFMFDKVFLAALTNTCNRFFLDDDFPINLYKSTVVLLYKNKGLTDDPLRIVESRYRIHF